MITKRTCTLMLLLAAVALSCNLPAAISTPTGAPALPTATLVLPPVTLPQPAASTSTPVSHLQSPPLAAGSGAVFYDVDSAGTAAEKRAPYGDAYDLNLLERPFSQDMTYLSNLDIRTFRLTQDGTWYFVSIKTIGSDPNALPETRYAVELDVNKDGFGDFIIVAQPPYTTDWTTQNVRVFADKNHNTSGLSPRKSDAPFDADGYETLIFDGAQGVGDDPDLAWVRLANNAEATIQFAFKKSWAGPVFMFGVLADAGLKDVSKLDYVDRFTEEQAGSPVRSNPNYPLKALYAVDNTCRQAVGFVPSGYEPMLCPKIVPPTQSISQTEPPNQCADIQPSDCSGNTPYFWPYPHCACSSVPYTGP
jgi:hypothetical protein